MNTWMNVTSRALVAGLAALAPAGAVAQAPQPVTTSTPLFSQVVVFTLPAGWKAAHKSESPNGYLIEFIPQGQDIKAWKDLVTLQAYRGLGRKPEASPKNFLGMVASRMEKACPGKAVAQSLGDGKVDGFDAHVAVLGCGSIGGKSEIAVYLAIRGSDDLYMIHRAFRGEPFDRAKPPLDADQARQAIAALRPVKICERSEPQAQCWQRKPR